VQIDVPEELGLGQRADFYESTGAYRDMVVTHLFQVMAFTAMEPPTALEPYAISEEKNKVFRSMLPIEPTTSSAASTSATATSRACARLGDRDLHRAEVLRRQLALGGVPFYLRTGKRMAEGRGSSRSPSASRRGRCSRRARGGRQRPDHLTFDLADQSRMSLSFYGKRPGPGMRPAEAVDAVRHARDRLGGRVLEAYERLIYDAARGDRTLFTTADGIERLWELSTPCWTTRPSYAPTRGLLGTQPRAPADRARGWRLPFERGWRDPNTVGA
jgi:glucose-6-phosphate 1-dehydrogenase